MKKPALTLTTILAAAMLSCGPGEYLFLGPLTVNAAKKEIYVRDADNLPVYVYDMLGKPLRTLDMKRNLGSMDYFHVWDEEHLFVYNRYNPHAEWHRQREDSASWRLVSRTDTVVTDLPVRFGDGKRESMTLRQDFIGGGYTNRSGGDYLAKAAGGYVVSEPGLDTIYHWNRSTGALTPLVAQTPSFRSFEFPIGLFYEGESSEYLFLQTVERRLGKEISLEDFININRISYLGGYRTEHLALDKSDGSIYRVRLLNGDFADEREFALRNNFGLPAVVFVTVLQPLELIDLGAEGKLRGPLASLAPTLKEDDNPVTMIVTLK